jgi:hypothetical protein
VSTACLRRVYGEAPVRAAWELGPARINQHHFLPGPEVCVSSPPSQALLAGKDHPPFTRHTQAWGDRTSRKRGIISTPFKKQQPR